MLTLSLDEKFVVASRQRLTNHKAICICRKIKLNITFLGECCSGGFRSSSKFGVGGSRSKAQDKRVAKRGKHFSHPSGLQSSLKMGAREVPALPWIRHF